MWFYLARRIFLLLASTLDMRQQIHLGTICTIFTICISSFLLNIKAKLDFSMYSSMQQV